MSKKNFTFKDASMKDLINYFNSIRVKLGKSNLPLHEPDIDYKDQKEVILIRHTKLLHLLSLYYIFQLLQR